MITINARGARTLADARPLIFDGHNVYVVFNGDVALLSLGGHFVAERPAAELVTVTDAQDWAYELIEEATELVAQVDDEAAEAAYADAVSVVRGRARGLIREAESLETLYGPDDRVPHLNSRGRVFSVGPGDPRHPRRRAKSLRREAEVLSRWTAEDEAEYSRYVSDGLADTDGSFIPLDRFTWRGVR